MEGSCTWTAASTAIPRRSWAATASMSASSGRRCSSVGGMPPTRSIWCAAPRSAHGRLRCGGCRSRRLTGARAATARHARDRLGRWRRCVGSIGPGLLALVGIGPDGHSRASCVRWPTRQSTCASSATMRGAPTVRWPTSAEPCWWSASSRSTAIPARADGHPSSAPRRPTRLPSRWSCSRSRSRPAASRSARGVFGAEMQVELVNDGPMTIWLDSEA